MKDNWVSFRYEADSQVGKWLNKKGRNRSDVIRLAIQKEFEAEKKKAELGKE